MGTKSQRQGAGEKTWTYFTGTYDSKAKNEHRIVYVNGKRAGASTRSGKVAPTNNPVEVGRWGRGSFFVGIVDEVAIFNAILSEDDLQSIMEKGLLAKPLGGEAVSLAGRLTSRWTSLKRFD